MKGDIELKYIKTISYDVEQKPKPPFENGQQTNGHAVVGAPSTIIEPPNVYKSRWRSIRVMYLTMFLSSVSFSICMSSLWPYLKLLDSAANTDYLGWVVASYSMGQLLASPLFGAWANWRGKSREPLVVSMLINVLANVLYSYLQSIPSDRGAYLIVARALVGFGAGNVAVVRAYVSGATTLKERTAAMAMMSAFQSVGFIIGPVIQIAMVPIGYPGPVHIESIHLNLYTSPAILSAIVGVINIILLFAVFREHRVINDEDVNFSVQAGSTESIVPDYKPDTLAVISSILLFFVILFIFAVFETIGTPLTMHMYSWTKSNATLYVGAILGVGGVISIITFIIIRIISKRVNERFILLGGFVLCLLGFFIYLPWGDKYPSYQTATIGPTNVIPTNTTSEWINMTDTVTESWSFGPSTVPGIENTVTNNIAALQIGTVSLPSNQNGKGLTTVIFKEHHSIGTTDSSIQPSFSPIVADPDIPSRQTMKVSGADPAVIPLHPLNQTVNQNGIIVKKKSSAISSILTKIEKYILSDSEATNFTTIQPNNLTTTPKPSNKSSDAEAVGCPDSYKWCSYTPIVTFAQFIVGTLMIVIGYPTCNVMTYTLYSKILGPKPQGMMMGWLTASGSLARTIGPIFVSQVYNAYGPRVTFIAMIIIVFLAILMYLRVFKRLVPFRFSSDVLSGTKV